MGRPSDDYKGNEDLTGLYKDEDVRTPKTLSGCNENDTQKGSDGLTDLFTDIRTPKTLSGCKSNDSQKCSDGLTDLFRDKGPQTLQTLSGYAERQALPAWRKACPEVAECCQDVADGQTE